MPHAIFTNVLSCLYQLNRIFHPKQNIREVKKNRAIYTLLGPSTIHTLIQCLSQTPTRLSRAVLREAPRKREETQKEQEDACLIILCLWILKVQFGHLRCLHYHVQYQPPLQDSFSSTSLIQRLGLAL